MMRIRMFAATCTIAGLTLAASACGSGDDSASGANGDGSNDRGAAPQASVQSLLLTADEFPNGNKINPIPGASSDRVLESMKLPAGAKVAPAECADKASVVDALVGRGDVAVTAGNIDGKSLMLGDVVAKGGVSLDSVVAANKKCPKFTYSGDNVTATGTQSIGENVSVDGAENAVTFTITSKADVLGTSVSTMQYGVAAQTNGVVIIVSATSLDSSDSIDDKTRADVLAVANAQSAKISAAD